MAKFKMYEQENNYLESELYEDITAAINHSKEDLCQTTDFYGLFNKYTKDEVIDACVYYAKQIGRLREFLKNLQRDVNDELYDL